MNESNAVLPRRIDRSGVVLRGEQRGVGPTVLLLHAGGESRRVWAPVVDGLLGAGFRCVAYDQRGHGESGGSARALADCAEDVAAMVEAEPGGCVLVGASLGGLAAVAALGDPAVRARVAGVVLVDVVPELEADRVLRFLAGNGIGDAFAELVDDILGAVPVLCRTAGELECPVLLVRGGIGSAVDDGDVDRLSRLVPHATVVAIAGASHLVARDRPGDLARAVTDAAVEWFALGDPAPLGSL